MKKTILLTLVLGLGLTACTSNETVKTQRTQATPVQASPQAAVEFFPTVYARLTKKDNAYTFAEFSLTKPEDRAPWVELNSLKPAFDTSKTNCTTAQNEPDERNYNAMCDSDNGHLFRTASYGVGDATMDVLGRAALGFVTFGVGAVIADSPFKTTFDKEAFDAAAKEAAEKLNHKSFLRSVKAHQTSVKTAKHNYEKAIDDKQSQIEQSIVTRYKDLSGIFTPKGTVISTQIRKHFKSIKVRNATFNTIEQLNGQLADAVEKAENSVMFSIQCDNLDGWKHSDTGCGQKWGLNTSVKPKHTALRTITSKSAESYQYNPNYADKNIRVSSVEQGLKFHNNTNDFVKIKSVSLYINNKISTISNLNIELPPQSHNNSPMEFSKFSNHSHLTMYRVTKQSRQKAVNLGLAIKYSLAGQKGEKTLFKQEIIQYKNLSKS